MRYFDTRDWKGSAITCGKDQTTPCPMGVASVRLRGT